MTKKVYFITPINPSVFQLTVNMLNFFVTTVAIVEVIIEVFQLNETVVNILINVACKT